MLISFVTVVMEALKAEDPFSSLSLFLHTVCLSLYLPQVMCSPHLQIHLFLHPIIAYKEMWGKKQDSLKEADMLAITPSTNIFNRRVISLVQKQESDPSRVRGVRRMDNRTETELKHAEQRTLWREWRREGEQGEGQRVWKQLMMVGVTESYSAHRD